jgi:hypothetical protein
MYLFFNVQFERIPVKHITKTLGSTTGFLAAAAFSGLIAGTSSHASTSTGGIKAATARITFDGKAGVKARNLDGATHACKGKNDCKGQGGCSTGDGGCKGKNSCKGKGGCSMTGSTTQKL